MIVEIWAESSRNARVAEFTRRLDRELFEGIDRLVDFAKLSGVAAPTLDPRFAASVLFSLVSGVFRRIALESDFDAEFELKMALGVFDALFAGALSPSAEV